MFIVYAILAVASFVFTSGGWTAFVFVLPGTALLFVICTLVLLIANLVSKNRRDLFVSKSMIFSLLGIHILTVLMNTGDCGDGTGTYQFFQVLVGSNGWHLCNTGREALLAGFSPLVFLIYFIGLVSFLIKSYNSFENAGQVPEA